MKDNPLNLSIHKWVVIDCKGFESHHPDRASADKYAVSQSSLGHSATVDALVRLSEVEELIETMFDKGQP